VIIDREEADFYVGRTEFYSPEIDPEVLISKEKILVPGGFYDVRIDKTDRFELYGKAMKS
jgi:ribosomal protein S12 methylthiotransferase